MSADKSPSLRVDVGEVDGVVVLAPVGEVDIASVSVLQEVLHRHLDEGASRLLLDLEGLDYLDSTGLGCVTAARRRARELSGDIVIVCTRDRLLRLFSITGLDQLFTICASRDEALAKLQPGRDS